MHWGQLTYDADQPQRSAKSFNANKNREETHFHGSQIIPSKRNIFASGKSKSEDVSEDLANLNNLQETDRSLSMSMPVLEFDAKTMAEVTVFLSINFQGNHWSPPHYCLYFLLLEFFPNGGVSAGKFLLFIRICG